MGLWRQRTAHKALKRASALPSSDDGTDSASQAEAHALIDASRDVLALSLDKQV